MKKHFLTIFSVLAILPLGSSLHAFQASPATEDQATVEQKALNLESFEKIWTTIRDRHWDTELVGESWDRHRAELLPKIKAASSTDEARDVMTELISRLEQSHFGLIPSSSYDAMSGEDIGGGSCDIGITVRLIDGALLVTDIRPDGPAAKAGVTRGWSISKLRNRDTDKLIELFKKAAHGPQRLETIVGLVTGQMTTGAENDTIKVEFLDGANQTRELKLKCTTSEGKFAALGNLPPIRVFSKSKTLQGNIGYFHFNAFLDPMTIMPSYRNALRNEAHTAGVIIDLRGNYGGIVGMTMGMVGEFVSKPTSLGTMTTKGSKLKLFANPNANPIDVPVAVLVDECSISSAEFLAGGLQDNGLARVFGSLTAGLALPSVVEKLPNGDGFQYAIADYHSAGGDSLEMNGVQPDQKVDIRREELLSGKDPVLNAAVQWINQQKK